MSLLHPPSLSNHFHADHLSPILRSYHQLTGRHLISASDTGSSSESSIEAARLLNEAPFFVASHGLEDDPVLNYGNLCALDLFAMNWDEFTKTPSRYTAEAPNRAERERLLKAVSEKGFIDDYSGVRITADGRRFRIHQATVWNVHDDTGKKIGQAATFSEWDFDI
jgi:hypothetical protein